jgi:hypothetical protein
MTAEPLDAEDAKLVVLARSAMAHAEAGSGAPVGLSALQVTALPTTPASQPSAKYRRRRRSSSPTARATSCMNVPGVGSVGNHD